MCPLVSVCGDQSGEKPDWVGRVESGLDRIESGPLRRIEASIDERLSATRQASRIKWGELEQALHAMKLRVIPAEDSPSLDSLLERDIDESDPGFW